MEQHVQTKREIQALLLQAGLRPRHRFGQHFLIDGNLMRRLVAAAEIQPDDVVLEVGCGTGALTDLLAARARRVFGVEIDRDLLRILFERFHDSNAVTLIGGDILDGKHRLNPEVSQWLNGFGGSFERTSDGDGRGTPCNSIVAGSSQHAHCKLVANLPYQIASSLVMILLTEYPMVSRLCFTVQAEVGQRMLASPGGKDYGPLSIVCQILSRMEKLAEVPRHAFWPQPSVDSMMIRADRIAGPLHRAEKMTDFLQLLRKVFDHRRKKLGSALKYARPVSNCDSARHYFDISRRPETLSPEEWVTLFELLNPN